MPEVIVLELDKEQATEDLVQFYDEIDEIDEKLKSLGDNEIEQKTELQKRWREIKTAISEVEGSLEEASKKSEKFEDSSKGIGKGFQDALGDIDLLSMGSEKFNEILSSMGINVGKVQQAKGGLVKIVKSLNIALGGSSMALNVLKIALISTGIGAIVVLVGSLVAVFQGMNDEVGTSSRRFAEMGKRIIEALPFGEQLLEWVADLAEAFGGLELIWVGVSEVIMTTLESISIAIAEFLKGNFQKSLDAIVNNAKVAASNAMEEMHKERIRINNEIAREELAIEVERLERLLRVQKAYGNDTTELEREILAKKIQMQEFNSQAFKDAQIDLLVFNIEKRKEEEELFLEAQMKKREATEGEMDFLRTKAQEQLDLTKYVVNEELKLRGEKIKIEKKELEKFALFRARLQQLSVSSELNGVKKLTSDVAGVLKEGSKGWKALKIGETIIETYQGSLAAYTSMIKAIPGPFGVAAGAIAAGAVIARGIRTVSQIRNTKLETTGSSSSISDSSSSSPSPSASSSASQDPAFNPLSGIDFGFLGDTDSDNISDLNDSERSTGSITKAYVISEEITDEQVLDEEINQLTRL